MSDVRDKKQDPSPKVKELMTGFESGKVGNGTAKYSVEKPIARPGGAKKLAKEFEKKSESSDAERKPPQTPTSPAPKNPLTSATSDEKPPATAQAPEQEVVQTQVTQTQQPPASEAKPGPPEATANSTLSGTKYVHIVYADMERQGFNGQVLDNTVSALKAQGHTVNVSDLYRSKFMPLPTRQDAGVADNAGNFLYEESMLIANLNNKVSADIRAEQEQLKKADLVIFIFRFLPSGVPAMLQGYINRVLSEGFGADFTSKAIFDQGKLAGKKAMLCMSCLLNVGSFSKTSAFGELDGYLRPIQYGTLRYSGFDVLAPQFNDDYFYGGDTQQKALLDTWDKRLTNLINEKPIAFV